MRGSQWWEAVGAAGSAVCARIIVVYVSGRRVHGGFCIGEPGGTRPHSSEAWSNTSVEEQRTPDRIDLLLAMNLLEPPMRSEPKGPRRELLALLGRGGATTPSIGSFEQKALMTERPRVQPWQLRSGCGVLGCE